MNDFARWRSNYLSNGQSGKYLSSLLPSGANQGSRIHNYSGFFLMWLTEIFGFLRWFLGRFWAEHAQFLTNDFARWRSNHRWNGQSSKDFISLKTLFFSESEIKDQIIFNCTIIKRDINLGPIFLVSGASYEASYEASFKSVFSD